MKTNKKVIKRTFSQRNKKLRINEQKKIEIIEEEDKESSTSEICKEKRFRDSSASRHFFNDSLRGSCQSRSINENNPKGEKKNDETKEDSNILNEDNKIIKEKKKSNDNNINIKEISKLNIQQDDKKENNEIKNKNKKLIKNEVKDNLKQNVIQININNNQSKVKDNSENADMNSSNNDNITISNSNSINENNSFDIENFELEYSKTNEKKITKTDNNIDNKEVNMQPKAPKDKKTNKRIINDIKLDTPKNIIFKNVLNRNKINNININTIKTKNIIIINNNIINNNTKSYVKNEEVKLNMAKEPEDAKKPKDNKNKKKLLEKKSKEQPKKSVTEL